MGLSKKFTCFYLLLLLLLLLLFQLESSTDHGSARHASFKPVSASSRHFRPLESSHGGFQGDAHRAKDGDEVFGDEKRKVHTGPNPLHNR
ncbi:Uncharacterized protein TCM_040867 [Theobroma cacao]|uniref:Uncharacterized protein n=1 Tax=Theobroma cacao TaxID=3641 RepID=A0A061GSM2_THECC|nr:Uncharacterized protein TCM_040867 [Theobroma cacao]